MRSRRGFPVTAESARHVSNSLASLSVLLSNEPWPSVSRHTQGLQARFAHASHSGTHCPGVTHVTCYMTLSWGLSYSVPYSMYSGVDELSGGDGLLETWPAGLGNSS